MLFGTNGANLNFVKLVFKLQLKYNDFTLNWWKLNGLDTQNWYWVENIRFTQKTKWTEI